VSLWLIAFAIVQLRDRMAGVKPFLVLLATMLICAFMISRLGVWVLLPLGLIVLVLVFAAALKLSRLRWMR
jgi:hypothetical protein